MNRSYVQPRFRCTGQGFIVLAQPATTSQPRQCSLNHPPAWQHLKLMAGPGTLDDLQDPGPDIPSVVVHAGGARSPWRDGQSRLSTTMKPATPSTGRCSQRQPR